MSLASFLLLLWKRKGKGGGFSVMNEEMDRSFERRLSFCKTFFCLVCWICASVCLEVWWGLMLWFLLRGKGEIARVCVGDGFMAASEFGG